MGARSRSTGLGRVTANAGSTAATGPSTRLKVFLVTSVDKCTTFNSNDHQTGRNATLIGTVNGQPFDTYEVLLPEANIFYNHFVYVTVGMGIVFVDLVSA